MPRRPLPAVGPGRTEFGFNRTVCACSVCVRYCKHVPGYLIPADLDRIRGHLGGETPLQAWADTFLRASLGAIVRQAGQLRRIPTLVPARRVSGACVFLTAGDRCQIHAAAPYGCAFFDAHQPHEESVRRSLRGLQSVADAWASDGMYARVWRALDAAGLRAVSPEVARGLSWP